MAGDVPVWPDNMALMTVKGGCLQYFVEKLGVLFFVHNTVHIFWTKHSLIFLRQPEFFFRHLIFS